MQYQLNYILVDGIRVHYACAGSGKKVIIGLHGWAGAWTDFRSVFPALPKGWRMIVPDLPGCGSSSKLKAEHTIEAYSKWLEGFAKALGLKDFTILAICASSPIAIHYAHKHRVKALVFFYYPFIHPGLITPQSRMRLIASVGSTGIGRLLLHRLRMSDAYMNHILIKGLPPEAAESAMTDIWNKRQADIKATTEFMSSITHADMRKEWAGLRMPILIISPQSDKITYAHLRESFSDRANIRFISIGNSAHYWDNKLIKKQNAFLKAFLAAQ